MFNNSGQLVGNIPTNVGATYATDGNVYIKSNGYSDWLTNILNGKVSTTASCNKNWNWADGGGQPNWLWGGNDGSNMYVYNPANFSVAYANKAWGIPTYTDQAYYVAATERKFSVFATNGGIGVDNVLSLGAPSTRWSKVYAATATISTSDRNMKKNIHKLTDIHKKLFMKLIPVSYLFKDGESGRTHIGFIAQDVEDAMRELNMSPLDFAGFCKDVKMKERLTVNADGDKIIEEIPILDDGGNEEYIYSLRYEEFIALNTAMIQDLYKEINKLRKLLER